LIAKDDYLSAMERSVVKDLEIKHLLKNALTDTIHERALFMTGLDVSYHYEGYRHFRAEDV
jgi:cell filamentation protein